MQKDTFESVSQEIAENMDKFKELCLKISKREYGFKSANKEVRKLSMYLRTRLKDFKQLSLGIDQ